MKGTPVTFRTTIEIEVEVSATVYPGEAHEGWVDVEAVRPTGNPYPGRGSWREAIAADSPNLGPWLDSITAQCIEGEAAEHAREAAGDREDDAYEAWRDREMFGVAP